VLAYLAISLVRLTFLIKGHMQHVPWLLVYLTAWRFDFLAMGIMLAFLNRKWSRQICNLVGDAGPFLTPWLILLPLWIVSMCESPFAPEARILHGLGLLLCGFAFSALVLLAANSRAFPASRGAVYRFMVYLGDRSYTLYVFHFPVFVLTWLVFRARILNGMVLPLGGFAFMALVLLAAKSRAFPASRGAAYRLMVYLGDRNYTLYLFYFFVFVLAGLVCHKFLPSVFSSGIAYGLGQLILGSLLLWLQPPLRATAHYAVCP
jgi:peptidoglycan/LPS O-acetylase OafA/YrhL